jgi:dihydroorotate dehydrogenase (fumarate)
MELRAPFRPDELGPLRWIAILRGQVGISLAESSVVHALRDVLKLLLAGADATMTASSLYKNAPATSAP